MRLDDPWNGRWVRLAAQPVKAKESGAWVFVFPPLTRAEWDQALAAEECPTKKCPAFRRTFKVRVVSKTNPALPPGLRLQAFGDSRWQEARFDLDFRFLQDGKLAGRVDVTNGTLVSVESLPAPRGAAVRGRAWSARGVKGASTGVRVRVQYAHNADRNSNDLTRVTVRLGQGGKRGSPHVCAPFSGQGFSFVPEDVLEAGAMRLPDFGALVTPSGKELATAGDGGRLDRCWPQRVRARVAEHAEATRASAMAGIPRLAPPRPVPLGAPSARQEFFVTPNGDWSTSLASLHTANGRDYKRWGFDRPFGRQISGELRAVLDTRAQPEFDGRDREDLARCLEDGHLPMIHVEWHTGPIHYHHALTTTVLMGGYGDDIARRGDETVALLTRLDMTNQAGEPKLAAVNFRFADHPPITLRDNGIIAIEPLDPQAVPQGLFAQRGQISVGKAAGGGVKGWTVAKDDPRRAPSILSYRAVLQPHETRSMYFKASLWHILITTDRDPQSGLYNQCVATVSYKVFATIP